ncbi:MAG: hypothetical protein IPI10_17350 [Bacteroidetes bacterium]|nr:hypothetical protein [Bacteroidota bacterium]
MISSKVKHRFFYSFPIQLLIVLLKKNHLLLLYWIILFGWVTNSSSQTFGIPYLFLDPEYMATVGFTSFLIIGFATGSFIMVFNISKLHHEWIQVSFHRYPFKAISKIYRK